MSDFDFSSIRYSAVYRGESTKDNNWKCDEWAITIKNNNGLEFRTSYYTGLGHRDKWGKPRQPDIKGIISALLLDSEANDYSFMDWCDNFGYNSDSIKAMNTYNECCNTARELDRLFTSQTIKQMRQALEDY